MALFAKKNGKTKDEKCEPLGKKMSTQLTVLLQELQFKNLDVGLLSLKDFCSSAARVAEK